MPRIRLVRSLGCLRARGSKQAEAETSPSAWVPRQAGRSPRTLAHTHLDLMSGPYWQAIVLLEELDGQHLKKRTLQQLGHCEATILLNHRGALS